MDKQTLEHAIDKALSYILSRQSGDGSWVEWELPPGSSDMWSTCFVGWKLSCIDTYHSPEADSAIRKAGKWVSGSMLPDAGWGYNAAVGSDADSTAHAILFLSSQAFTVPPKSYERLCQFQSADGGFSTYCSCGQKNSWVVSHPDVSPMALLALLTEFPRNELLITKGVEYIRRQRTPAGVWNSFWWNSPLYSTNANLSLLKALGISVENENMSATLLDFVSRTAFEAALQLRCICFATSPAGLPALHRIAERLIHEQAPDGSWRDEPILRVTDRGCFEPWNDSDAGMQFGDPNRLFTTSTIAEALYTFAGWLDGSTLGEEVRGCD